MFTDIVKLSEHVVESIKKSNEHESKLTRDVLSISGLSNAKLRHFFNNLCSFDGCKYLEIGTYTGSSLISALYNNMNVEQATTIDDWSMDINKLPEFQENIKRFNGNMPRFSIIRDDCWKINDKPNGKYNVYFYDGCHSVTCQHDAIIEYWEWLEYLAVILVDDYEVWRVQQGTIRAFDKLNAKKFVKYAYILPGGREHGMDGWWGGLGVFIIQK